MTRQAMWLEAIERRISSTTSMLSSIKGIKMLGLTSTLMRYVHNLRISELDISKKFRKLLVWNMAFGKLPDSLVYMAHVWSNSRSLVDSHFCADIYIRHLHRHLNRKGKCLFFEHVANVHLLIALFAPCRPASDSGHGLDGIYGRR